MDSGSTRRKRARKPSATNQKPAEGSPSLPRRALRRMSDVILWPFVRPKDKKGHGKSGSGSSGSSGKKRQSPRRKLFVPQTPPQHRKQKKGSPTTPPRSRSRSPQTPSQHRKQKRGHPTTPPRSRSPQTPSQHRKQKKGHPTTPPRSPRTSASDYLRSFPFPSSPPTGPNNFDEDGPSHPYLPRYFDSPPTFPEPQYSMEEEEPGQKRPKFGKHGLNTGDLMQRSPQHRQRKPGVRRKQTPPKRCYNCGAIMEEITDLPTERETHPRSSKSKHTTQERHTDLKSMIAGFRERAERAERRF